MPKTALRTGGKVENLCKYLQSFLLSLHIFQSTCYNIIYMHPFKVYRSGDFPGGPVVKNLPYNAGDTGSIPGQGTKIPHAPGQLSPHTTTTELAHFNSRACVPTCSGAHMPWSPHATTRGEKTRRPQLEKRKPSRHN